MDLMRVLRNKNVVVTELVNKAEDLRKQWESKFAGGISSAEKNAIFFEDFLWHVFSYEKLPCLTNEEAMSAFNSQSKKICYVFYQHSKRVFMLSATESLKAEDFDDEDDVYVVDQDFEWTYVHTHEEYCGPYFYSLKAR
ncbi:DUF4275 family protein [Ectobacillus panaciterrae]|uniref:DUF4275 family protein n=1 Tax=Ectobacillus panaciterrae TaxID=363872 RepID=UPI000408A942|nr:DUF4275 family protein [Ectobacillus panaciterrae]